MSDLATRTSASLVANASRILGVALPARLEQAFADAETLRHAGSSIAGPPVAQAVAEAVLAGRDPLASKAVQQAALASTLGQLNLDNRLRELGFQRTAEALRECADEVIDTWRPAVESAHLAFSSFRELMPGVDPLHEGLPTGLPARALTPWGVAKEAAAKLDALSQGWQAIASVCGLNPDGRYRPLILADLSLEQVESLGQRPKLQDVSRFEVTLELASIDTYNQRVQHILDERQGREAYADAAPQRAREHRRQTMGVVMIP